jgi:Bacterial Ig-like domain (group 3)/FG-GAP-like repeat
LTCFSYHWLKSRVSALLALSLSLAAVLEAQSFLNQTNNRIHKSTAVGVRPGRQRSLSPTDLAFLSSASGFSRGKTPVALRRSRQSSPAPIFFNPSGYGSGGAYALSVSAGDFNGDGKLDLVVANECQGSSCSNGAVSVLLGNGDGTFQAAKSYNSGGYEAVAVTVGDVNGDGNADLVVANECQSANQCESGNIGVLLGNGDGTFQTALSYSTGGVTATSVAIADLNGDGNPDLAVTNECLNSTCATGGVSVLLGSGNGRFQLVKSYATGGVTAMAVVIADFNQDGIPDLAVANQCQNDTCVSGLVGVLLGSGKGAFQAATGYASGGNTTGALGAADFNGDGKTDLVLVNQCQSTNNCSSGSVSVLLGKGNGTFKAAQNYASGGNLAIAAAVADVNGDGREDLLVGNQCEVSENCIYGSVAILLGNGDGTFQIAHSYISDGVFAASLDVADFNGDQKPDVVVANECQTSSNCSGTVTVLLGNGDGTFQVPPTYGSGGYNADSVAIGDLNGDEILDLVVSNLCKTADCSKGTAGVITVLLGNGDATFQAASTYPTGGFGSSSAVVADVNGDGKADVIVVNQCATSTCETGGSVSVFLGNGDGTLRPARTYASGGYFSLCVASGDFNNDGKSDLAVANQCQESSCGNGSVSVLLGNGDGSFQAAQSFPAAGFETDFVAVADFNADGNLDLAVTSQCQDNSCQNGGVSILLGKGDGTFREAQSYNSLGSRADSVTVADLNADGKPDLLVSNFCRGTDDCGSGTLTSMVGRGDGTFHYPKVFNSGGQYAYSLTAADFNGDGNIDVVLANRDNTALLLGNGDATFQTADPYLPGGIFVAAGDFNGDGQPDLVVASGSISTVTVLRNVAIGYRHSTTTALSSSPNPSAVYQSVLFTATVTSQFKGAPTGTVAFKSGTTVLGTGNVKNGQATLNYSFPIPHTNKITAEYSGDSVFLPSESSLLKQSVLKASTTTALTSSPNPSSVGQTVKFSATVAGQYGGTPTGTVTFKDGQTVLAQVSLNDGVAKYKTSSLSQGNHQISAVYSGDTNFHPSHATVEQMVQ